MTIPIAPPNIAPTQAQQDPTAQLFMRFLLQGAQGAQRAQELELEKQRLKLQQGELKRREQAEAQEQQLNTALGEGLRSLFQATEQAPTGIDVLQLLGFAPQTATTPSPAGSDEAAFQAWYKGVSRTSGLSPNPDDPSHQYDWRAAFRAGAKPDAQGHWPSQFKLARHPDLRVSDIHTQTGMPSAIGITPLGATVRQLPAQAIPAFVEQTRDIRKAIAEQRAATQRERVFNDALQQVPDEALRGELAQYFRLKQADVDLPDEAMPAMFPRLFASGVIDPARMNAAMTFMKTTGANFGVARRALGMETIPGVPDTLVSQSVTRPPRETEVGAAGYQNVMEREYPIILGLTEQAGGVTLPGAFLTKAFTEGVVMTDLLSEIQDPVQRQLTGSITRFITAATFAFSGKQTTNQEFQRFLATSIPFAGDDPETRQQKMAALQGYIDAVRTVAGVAGRPSVALERTLRLARLQGWNPNIVKHLEAQVADAKKWEADVRRQNSLFVDDTPTTSGTFEQNYQMWQDWLRKNMP